jgi:glucosamine-6-phosphate deaminase
MVHHDESDSSALDIGSTVRVVADYDAMSQEAAEMVALAVSNNPGAAITLPTGETPRGMYEELVRRITAGNLDFSRVHFFCLDDYLGTSIENEASLTRWLNDVFLEPANLHGDNVHFIPTMAPIPDAAADAYEDEIHSHGGLKLAVIGLGPNGHIGFNEPGSLPESRTRVVDLTEESRGQNALYYEGQPDIPAQAMTIGLGTILEADQIVLIVSGASKAGILQASLEGPMTVDIPGSFLRAAGSRLVVIADEAAASGLEWRRG